MSQELDSVQFIQTFLIEYLYQKELCIKFHCNPLCDRTRLDFLKHFLVEQIRPKSFLVEQIHLNKQLLYRVFMTLLSVGW